MVRPSRRREMAKKAVTGQGVCTRVAWRFASASLAITTPFNFYPDQTPAYTHHPEIHLGPICAALHLFLLEQFEKLHSRNL